MPPLSGRLLRLLIAVTALTARLLPGPRIIDDAFITFRYAQNLLLGNGLVFNAGERVLGTTTPLYAGILAGLGSLFGGAEAPFITIAWILNAALGAASCLLLAALGRQLNQPGAGLAAASVWAVAPMSVTFAIGGMETSLFVLLLLATFYFHFSGWRTALAAACAAVLLTRPDGLLFLAPIAVEQLRMTLAQKSGGRAVRLAQPAAALLLPLGLWALFASAYYGSPIPHSVAAKVAAYRLPPEAGFVRLLQHYATPYLGHLTFGSWWIAFGLTLFPVLFILGSLRVLRDRPIAWPFFLSPWIYLVAYSIANPLIFRWYLAPPLPMYFLGIFLGLQRVADDFKARWLLAVGSLLALLLTLNGWQLNPDHGPSRPAPEMAFIKLELLYEEVGRDLAGSLAEDQIVAAGDVGALGYFSGARILDTLGIISPESTEFYPADPDLYVINYAIPPELVNQLAPDYLIILEVYGRAGLLQDSRFLESYALVERLATNIYGSEGMLVFRRIETGQ